MQTLEQAQQIIEQNGLQIQEHNNSIHPIRGDCSELIQYPQSHIQQSVLNINESLGKIIAQVLAIEKFKKYTNKTSGWSVYLLNNEISQQRRNFANLEEECQKNGQQTEWLLAIEVFKKILKDQQDLLINQEHKQLLENILQPPPQQSSINIQPDMTYFGVIDIYHYQSSVNFHNSLQKDRTGADLLENINSYKNEFTKFLYFYLIEQQINYLDKLLNYVLINKTQGNNSTLQELSEYIQILSTQNDKQQLMMQIQLIIVVFPELANYFQELYNHINDNSLLFDNKIELNSIQFEYVLLIYDYVRTPKRKLQRRLAKETIDFMNKLAFVVRAGSVQEIKNLLKTFRKNFKQEMLIELEYLSDLFISIKLRLLMKMILQINVLQDSDFKDDYLNLKIVSYYDLAIFKSCYNQGNDNYENIYYEPSANVQEISVQQVLQQFTSVIQSAADLEKGFNTNDGLEKLKNKIKESKSSIENKITSPQTIIKLIEILNCIFMFQKLNVQTFTILYQYYLDLGEIELKNKDKYGVVDQVPNIYTLLLNFQKDSKTSFQNILEEIKKSISGERADDFSDLIKQIEQFDPNNMTSFLNNVKQLYYKEFKDHLLKLAQIGTQQFKEAVNSLIQQGNL